MVNFLPFITRGFDFGGLEIGFLYFDFLNDRFRKSSTLIHICTVFWGISF